MDGGACPLRRTSERTKRVIKNVFVGVDLAKEVHWVCAIDHGGKTLLSRKLRNGPEDVAALVVELRGLGGERRVGIDVMGGIATLLTAMLLEAGESLVHVPGRAVNHARQGTRACPQTHASHTRLDARRANPRKLRAVFS